MNANDIPKKDRRINEIAKARSRSKQSSPILEKIPALYEFITSKIISFIDPAFAKKETMPHTFPNAKKYFFSARLKKVHPASRMHLHLIN